MGNTMRILTILAGLGSLAGAAAAQDGPRFSAGYAYAKFLEEDGGSVPAGAYLSLSGGGRTTLELDAGYHRDSEGDDSVDSFTVLAGPKFRPSAGGRAEPFLHLLGGVRHDRIEFLGVAASGTALGGMGGGGVDVGTGGRARLRLGADFQFFRDEGINLQVLRLSAGVAF